MNAVERRLEGNYGIVQCPTRRLTLPNQIPRNIHFPPPACQARFGGDQERLARPGRRKSRQFDLRGSQRQGQEGKGTKITCRSIRADVVRRLDRDEAEPDVSPAAGAQPESVPF